MTTVNKNSLAEMLDRVDTSYMTEAEKIMIKAQADRAEYIGTMISSAFASVKSLFKSKKHTVATTRLSHA